MITTVVATVIKVIRLTWREPYSKFTCGKRLGMDLLEEEKINCAVFCRKMLTPMAVISREILGTFLEINR